MKVTRSLVTAAVTPAIVVSATAALVAVYERQLLSDLARTPDPDRDRSFSFPGVHRFEVATADGGQLHVEECGTGRVVLCLHGYGGTMAMFSLLAEQLASRGCRVIAVDQRGFGGSSPVPGTFAFDGLVDDAVTVLEALDLHDVIVLGHSMGGIVALGLAVGRPDVVAERVAGLVVMNSMARGPADSRWMRAQTAVLDWPFLERFGRHPRHGTALTRATFGRSPAPSLVEAARTISSDSPVLHRQGFARRLLGVDLTSALPQLDLPVLALGGSLDRVVSPGASQGIANAVTNGRLEVFDGAGHLVPLERAEASAVEIVAFADGLAARVP